VLGLAGWALWQQRPLAAAAPAPAAAAAVAPLAPLKPAMPASAAMPAASRAARQLQLSRAWVQQQAPARYTLQIALADPDPRKLERQLRKFDDEVGLDQLHVYPTRVAGEPRLGVLYAAYASRGEALAMKQQLAQEWGYQPQLRTISGVREEIRRTGADALWPK
jgi:septal ring-binding cell division protein DamX